MAIIKCKMCGGDIQLAEDKTFGTCEYCGCTMTFPKVSDEQRAAAFNRGNHFRRVGEFDKALAVYERIVAEDDADAEAHWCCALCRFGIEYVEDPATYEWLPTCHRASFDSFLEDVDYLAAVEHSDGITRRQYQKDAAKIAEVQRGILATSQNTEPYDVFISYKELDADGNRTRDSILAQEVYYRLTEKGWRVFFSRISLEDVPGTQYEPYIFAALNSAKVMIVVGTSAENLNAVWVKNEWSRYLSLMRKDRSKLLIPCYRDMDPYDLPEQLSVLMSYDMGKIGFIQDLIRGVDKVLAAEKPKETKKTDPAQAQPMYVSNEADAKTAAAVKRGNLALEESDWPRARDYFEQALTFDAESAEAYFGMALAENECRSAEDYIERAVSQTPERKTLTISLAEEHIRDVVGKCEIPMFISTGEIKSYYNAFNPLYRSAADGQRTILEKEKKNFENNRNIVLAFRFAKGKYRETLENVRNALYSALEDNVRVAEQEEHEAARQKEEKYQEFLQKKDLEVEELYQKKLAERENVYLGLCKEFENANESYRFRTLKERFQFLGDYKDCEEYVRRCGERAAELEKKERAEQEEQRKEKLYTTYHKVFDAPEPKTIRQNEWETAKQGFESLGEYRDAPACAQKCAERIEQIKREEAAKAKAAVEEAERQRIFAEKAAAEKKAKQKRTGILTGVIAVLAITAVFVVLKVIIPANQYKAAEALCEAGQYEDALAAFKALNGYKDSAAKIEDCKTAIKDIEYCNALSLIDSGDYETAYLLLDGMDYKNSTELQTSIRPQYRKAMLRKAQAGSYVFFGLYEQDNNNYNGKEEIEWLVLSKEGNRILVISRYGLDCQPYNTSYWAVTWETCWLRRWLNSTFLNAAFSDEERMMIPSVTVIAENNPDYDTSPGNNTTDQVFLLSIKEAKLYFRSDKARVCGATTLAEARGAWSNYIEKVDGKEPVTWWLRTPGDCWLENQTAVVTTFGEIDSDGAHVNTDHFIVRPALWIETG